jgi:membrane fusion protein, multidrug efflux system
VPHVSLFRSRLSSLLVKIGLSAAAVALIGGALVGSAALRARGGGAGREPPAGSAAAPRAAAAPVPVDVFVVEPRPFEVAVSASGTLLARESVELVSELARRLVRVRAQEGATVKKGQVLFELDGADLGARLRRLQVQRDLAKLTLERQTKLLEQGLASQGEWEATRARYDELEAERRVLGVDLGKTRIRAPFAGTLGLRRVSEGAWVSSNTVLTTLQDTSQLKIDFSLPERYSSLELVGRSFRFTVAGRAETFTGKITAVEGALQQSSRSVLARGLVEDPKGLSPGTFASVSVPLSVERALLVPSIAVTPDLDGRRVFRVVDGKAQAVKVEVGDRGAEKLQIISGLSPGDRVIVTNLLRVRDGAPVRVVAGARP